MSDPTPIHRARDRRRGFTLVELLVTISIIGILAGMGLGAMGSAVESAKLDRTKATIAKINAAVLRRWSELQTRRVPIDFSGDSYVDANGNGHYDMGENFFDSNGNGVYDASTAAKKVCIRLNAIRELMRYELPDRYAEIPDASVTAIDVYQPKAIMMQRSSTSFGYARKLSAGKTDQFEAAECLYLIVMSDPDDAQSFTISEFADVDNDGMLELVDGWGNPISWLRWPAGLVSETQPLYTSATPPAATLDPVAGSRGGAGAVPVDHDPFDSRQIDPLAFRVIPLIFSAGPDGKYELRANPQAPLAYADVNYATASLRPETLRLLSIYASNDIGAWEDVDSDGKDGSLDNVHNHLLGTR